MTDYSDMISKLQKKVQINPLDSDSWLEMIRLCDEAISLGVDTARWQQARKVMVQQARLMGVKI